MYVLDTNAFYYAAGISECTYDVEKLQKLVDENEVFISSTSLFEFLIKFRNDIQTIHKGGKYLWEKKIKLAGNVINPLPNNFTGDIINLTESELQTLCSNILENKIDAESRFISILFDMCLFSGFYFSAMSDGVEPSGFCFEVFEKAFRMFANINLEVFVDIFTEGYKTDDCENYVRNCFYNLLAFELEKGIPFIERAKAVKDEDEIPDIDDWLSSEDYSHDTEKLSNKMKAKTSTAFLQRLAIKYWKSNNDPELKNHISKLKSIFDKKVKLTALQDYYYDTLVGIMTKGAALWKNDLLDAIILCNVQDLHVMITYDASIVPVESSEHFATFSTDNYLREAVVAAIASFLAVGTGFYHSPADKFFLYLQVNVFRNNGFVIAFYIGLWNKTVIFNSGFVKKVGGVGLLEQGIIDVLLITENFVDGACVPLFSSGTGKNTVTLQTGGNLVHTETF